ncbi:MAG: hypothetical protein K2L65_03530, partial [Lactobacillus sp.]|nr:hypothetical protein [Lactobacillus sp.]
MRRLHFKNKKNRKQQKNYIDPNALREDQDDPKAYLKELAGLATIIGAGATGATILPNDRVYAARTSVDPKSQIVGSVADSTQTGISTGVSNKPNSKSNEKGFSISNSEAKSVSASISKSLLISQSTSISASQSISHSQSLSKSLSQSHSISESLSQSSSILGSLKLSEKETSSSGKRYTTTSSKSHTIKNSTSKNFIKNSSSNSVDNSLSQESPKDLTANNSDTTINSLELSNASYPANQLLNENLKTPFGLQTSTTKTTNVDKVQSDKKKQSYELNLNNSFVELAQTNDGVNVNTAQGFYNQINNGNASVINLTGDIDLGNYTYGAIVMNNSRSVTVNGNGHTLNFGNSYINPNWSLSSSPVVLTFNDTNIYTANKYGSVFLKDYGVLYNSNVKLIYNNVHAIGGTAVFADTTVNDFLNGRANQNKPLKTFEISGNTTITGVNSYTFNGNSYSTSFNDDDGHGTALLSPAFNLIIDNGSHVTLDGGNNCQYDVKLVGNNATH